MLNFKKFVYGLLLFFSWSTLPASNCDLPALEVSYQRLCASVDAHQAVYALGLADSLIRVMQDRGEDLCPLSLWIQYEKGEALELLRNRSGEALNLYYKLVRKAEKAGLWELVAETYISIARTHEVIGRPQDCLRNLLLAREIIDRYKLKAVFSHFAVRYASYHRIFDNKDSAVVYAAKAIEYGRYYKVQRSELDGHLLMGSLSKDFQKSTDHFQAAANIYLKRRAFYGAAGQKMNIASRYFGAGDLDKATIHLDTAGNYAFQIPEDYIGYYDVLNRFYELKAELFKARGLIDSAFYYLHESITADRMSEIRINQQEINQQETAFALEKEQAKLDFEQQRSSYLRWGLVLMGLLLVAMAAGHFNNERKKRFIAKQNKLIAAKNEALRESLRRQSTLLSEVHHRVKNNLQLVMSLLTLKGSKIPEANMQIHFDDLSTKVHSIALIHQQLYRTEAFDKVNFRDYLTELTNHFMALQSDDQPFSIQLEAEEILLNLETVLPLGIICSELISNSLKYARLPDRPLFLNLSVQKTADNYTFRYQDNGPGYPDNTLKHKPNSMGGMLISSMVRQLKAESNTYNQDGAVFTLSFQEKPVSMV